MATPSSSSSASSDGAAERPSAAPLGDFVPGDFDRAYSCAVATAAAQWPIARPWGRGGFDRGPSGHYEAELVRLLDRVAVKQPQCHLPVHPARRLGAAIGAIGASDAVTVCFRNGCRDPRQRRNNSRRALRHVGSAGVCLCERRAQRLELRDQVGRGGAVGGTRRYLHAIRSERFRARRPPRRATSQPRPGSIPGRSIPAQMRRRAGPRRVYLDERVVGERERQRVDRRIGAAHTRRVEEPLAARGASDDRPAQTSAGAAVMAQAARTALADVCMHRSACAPSCITHRVRVRERAGIRGGGRARVCACAGARV